MPEDKSLDLSSLEEIIGNKLKFANQDNLRSILGLESGAVSSFGLINGIGNKVKLIIDEEV